MRLSSIIVELPEIGVFFLNYSKQVIESPKFTDSTRRPRLTRFLRKCLLSSIAFVGLSAPQLAYADGTVSIGGAPATPLSPTTLTFIPTVSDVDIVVTSDQPDYLWVQNGFPNTAKVNITVNSGATLTNASGLLGAIWSQSVQNDTVIVNNGTITSPLNGVTIGNAFVFGGNATVSGTGSITAATGTALLISANNNVPVIRVDGQTAGITATAGNAIDIRSNFTLSGTTRGGDVLIGQTTQLGPINAGLNGILVTQALNLVGDGNIRIRAGDITATAGYGVRTLGWTGNTDIVLNGNVTSGLAGVYGTATTGNQSVTVNGGTIRATADNGLVLDSRFAPDGGNVTFTGNGNSRVDAAFAGIWALTDAPGTVTIDGFAGGIKAGTEGILVNSNGTFAAAPGSNVNIGQTTQVGPINAGTIGIWAVQFPNAIGDGNINIRTGAITSGSFGIVTNFVAAVPYVTTGATNIVTNGPLRTGDTAIYSASGTGPINITSNGQIDSANYGIWGQSVSGAQTIISNAAINSVADGIVGFATGGANISITNNAVINSAAATAGHAGITTNNLSGASTINANANVYGKNSGVYTLATSGTTTTNIRAGVVSYGDNFGVFNQGGTNIVNNAGTITTTPNTTGTPPNGVPRALTAVGPNQATGLFAYSSFGAVRSTINNTGTITGGLFSDTGMTTINNSAPGVINLLAGFANQTTTGMTINNNGRVNSYAGTTTLLGNRFNNLAGGIIDLTLNSAPTDILVVQNFSAQAGSRIRTNFNVDAALGIGDAGTSGTADTIHVVAGASTPVGVSFIDLQPTGGRNGAGEPVPLTGSVALVFTGVTLAAPSPGDQVVNSANYTFGTVDPSTGARVFTIVSDGRGGAFLQWTPRINGATMGAFLGGDLNSKAGRGSSVAAARSGMAGASSVASLIGSNSGQCLSGDRKSNIWTTASYGGSNFTGGSGHDLGGAIGWEGRVGDVGDNECAQTAIGMFGYGSTAKSDFATGSRKADGYGVGAYVRKTSNSGFYASLLGSGGAIDGKLTNSIFRSTANTNAFGWMVNSTAGYEKPLSAKALFDLRGSASYLAINTHSFSDTLGFTVKNLRQKLWTLEGTVGVSLKASANTSLFLRGGAKLLDLKRSSNAYDVIVKGSSSLTLGTAEAGLRSKLSGRSLIGLSGNGDFGSGLTSYGGRVFLRVSF